MKKSVLIFLSIFPLAHFVCAQNNIKYYTENAINNSPLINGNKNQIIANQFEVEGLKAFYTKPQIGVVANIMLSPIISKDNGKTSLVSNPESATNYYGYDLAYSNGGNYQAMLNVTQSLFNGKRFEIASEQLDIKAQSTKNNTILSKHDIEKIVTDQYILCLKDIKQVAYAEAMVKLITDQKEILKKLVESSIYKQSDLVLIDIELQNFLAQRRSFKANYRRDLMDLNIICGINDTTLVQLPHIDITMSSEVSTSMFLEKYRLDSLNLIAQQNAFELKYKPQISVFANTGLNAVYAPTIPNRFGFSAGLSLTCNIFDGKQKKLNRDKTKVLEESISFYKENFITQNTIRKLKILAELKSYNDRILIAEKQLDDYELLLNNYKKEIISGQLSILSYTSTLKNMALIQRDYALLFSQKQSLINAYNYWNW